MYVYHYVNELATKYFLFSIRHPVHRGLQLGEPNWEETSCLATPCCPTLASPPSSAMEAWCERCMPSVTTRLRSVTEAQCTNVIWTQQLCHFQVPLQYDSQNLWYVCADRTKKKKTANTRAAEETGVTSVGRCVTRTTVQRRYKSAVGAVRVLFAATKRCPLTVGSPRIRPPICTMVVSIIVA